MPCGCRVSALTGRRAAGCAGETWATWAGCAGCWSPGHPRKTGWGTRLDCPAADAGAGVREPVPPTPLGHPPSWAARPSGGSRRSSACPRHRGARRSSPLHSPLLVRRCWFAANASSSSPSPRAVRRSATLVARASPPGGRRQSTRNRCATRHIASRTRTLRGSAVPAVLLARMTVTHRMMELSPSPDVSPAAD